MRVITGTLVLALLALAGLGQQPDNKDAPKPVEAKKPEPPKEKPFDEIVKEAKEIKGLFTLYRTEEKVYLELLPAQLGKIYMVSLTCDTGLGERGFYAGAMCGETPFIFHKQGKNVHMLSLIHI